MKTPSYDEKRAAAVAQTKRVEKADSHPKEWDKYIANRQKQVKIQKRGNA